MIVGGDHDEEFHDEFEIVTNMSCEDCGSLALWHKTRD